MSSSIVYTGIGSPENDLVEREDNRDDVLVESGGGDASDEE